MHTTEASVQRNAGKALTLQSGAEIRIKGMTGTHDDRHWDQNRWFKDLEEALKHSMGQAERITHRVPYFAPVSEGIRDGSPTFYIGMVRKIHGRFEFTSFEQGGRDHTYLRNGNDMSYDTAMNALNTRLINGEPEAAYYHNLIVSSTGDIKDAAAEIASQLRRYPK